MVRQSLPSNVQHVRIETPTMTPSPNTSHQSQASKPCWRKERHLFGAKNFHSKCNVLIQPSISQIYITHYISIYIPMVFQPSFNNLPQSLDVQTSKSWRSCRSSMPSKQTWITSSCPPVIAAVLRNASSSQLVQSHPGAPRPTSPIEPNATRSRGKKGWYGRILKKWVGTCTTSLLLFTL